MNVFSLLEVEIRRLSVDLSMSKQSIIRIMRRMTARREEDAAAAVDEMELRGDDGLLRRSPSVASTRETDGKELMRAYRLRINSAWRTVEDLRRQIAEIEDRQLDLLGTTAKKNFKKKGNVFL